MNTKVKVGIAAAIVAALVALIVLDQKTTPKDDQAGHPSPGSDSATIVGSNTPADAPIQRLREDEINNLLKKAEKEFGEKAKPAPGLKGGEEKNEKTIRSSAGEDYVIKDGDTFETIALAKLGSKSYAGAIAEANPGLKPTALRVGKHITLPGKAEKVVEKKDDVAVVKPVESEKPVVVVEAKPAAITNVGGQKIYTVQPGDTLSQISAKVYNTSRHVNKIYEANKDVIEDPNTLQVGAKLVMPDLPSKPASANSGASTAVVATTNPAPAVVPAGAKTVIVAEGDRLWNIAAKYAAEKKVGILEMIKMIAQANLDKQLREDGSNLRAGWQLIIPE